eukprot:m51a1_g11828 hypothetical protein (624) ;mRNA; r:431062-433764
MAVVSQVPRIGFAAFDPASSSLRLGGSFETPAFTATRSLKFQIRPRIILTSTRAPLKLLDALSESNADDEVSVPHVTQLVAADFDVSSSQAKLASVQVSDSEEMLRVASFLRPLVHGDANTEAEGVSLFSVLDSTKSKPGRCLLSSALRDIRLCLSKIHDVSQPLAALSASKATHNDWLRLRKTLAAAVDCQDLLSQGGPPGQILSDARAASEGVATAAAMLATVIDVDATTLDCKPRVRKGVDASLDSLRRAHAALGSLLDSLAERELHSISSPLISRLHAVYAPQLGFLLSAPLPTPVDQVDQYKQIAGLEYQFHSTSAVYFKSETCTALDERIGDVYSQIVDKETEIFRALRIKLVSEHSGAIMKMSVAFAELDVVASFALVARERRYCRPQFVDGPVLTIRGGKHPLLDPVLGSSLVPNDICLGNGSCILVVTGPNSSGKSVFLQQVGLIAVMAHAGSFVSAQAATIGSIDALFSRSAAVESLQHGHSSFMSDCVQMSTMLSECTGESLLLVDEFGKGTEVVDGSALIVAIVEKLASRGFSTATCDALAASCPMCLFSTHWHEAVSVLQRRVKTDELLDYVTMRCMLTEEKREVVLLYQAVRGVSCQSFGHEMLTRLPD